MSSPSANEKSKHTDEESLSDKESFTDEQKVTKKERKRKRKSKELLKSPSNVAQIKASPGTSKKVDFNLMVGDSDSNSGEKHVGVVGDNIKHLNLNEGGKVTDSKPKDGLKSTEVQAEIGVSPGISVSQPEHIVESPLDNNQVVQQPPANEQDSLINEPMNVDKDLKTMVLSSTSPEEVRSEVPYNSLNVPGDLQELKADLRFFPSTSVAYRRTAFAHKADDTLDDVSEISDFTDILSDSSLGQMSSQSERRPSQETSSDAKAEGLIESVKYDCKMSAQKSKDGNRSGKVSNRNAKEARKDNETENKDADEQEIAENVPDKQHSKCASEKHGTSDGKVVDPHDSNVPSTERPSVKDENENNQHGGEQDNEQGVGNADITSAGNQGNEEHGSLAAGSTKLSGRKNSDDNAGIVDQVEEPMEEQDGSVHHDHSDNDASESYPSESIENPDIEQNEMDEESREDDQLDDQEPVVEQNYSSEQSDLNNASEQGSSDYQNFAHGHYVRFPIDSSSTDSGIENSLAVFEGNYQVPENSESNEGSALGSSAAAGFQNLQNWVERGAAGASLPQSNEGIPGPSNTTEQSGLASTYANVISRKIVKVAVMETIEDLPMECAEHFAETSSEGSILEVMPDAQIKCGEPIKDEIKNLTSTLGQRFDTSGTNLLQDQMKNQNLNVISGSKSSPSNEPKAKLVQRTGANVQEPNPAEIDEENNSYHSEETAANNNLISSLSPKTSRRLVKGDSDQVSSSSQEQSLERSLADMDDAIESSDSLSREADPQKTATNLLQTLSATGITLGKGSGSKPPRSKRRSRIPSESNSPFKKRKNATTCGQQAGAFMESLKRQKPDSDDESSKEDRKV